MKKKYPPQTNKQQKAFFLNHYESLLELGFIEDGRCAS